MIHVFAQSRLRAVVATVVVAATATILALVAHESGAQGGVPDRATLPQKPILENASAFVRADLRVTATPRAIANLPADVAPHEGTVRELVTGLGRGNIAVYAWPSADGRVCFQTSLGSGGCQTNFFGDASLGVSDPDRVGAGLPAYVWGFVSDAVSSVNVVVDGKSRRASIRNNVAFLELAEHEYPDVIEFFTVRLKGGTVQTIDY
ncbi:MAG TPA: hypothetical protein VF230_16560 [Acidimicrobiales bacterium]